MTRKEISKHQTLPVKNKHAHHPSIDRRITAYIPLINRKFKAAIHDFTVSQTQLKPTF